MGDWLGILFFGVLAAGIYFGLRSLAKPVVRTEEEFERNAAESTLLGSGMNALNEILNPAEARAREVQTQLKEGRFDKKKADGNLNGDDDGDPRVDRDDKN
jgi:hypothetical protein